jgi:hypothetical protein
LRPWSFSDSSDFRFALLEQMAPIFLLGFKNNNYYYRRTQRNMKELEFSLQKFSGVHVSMNCRHRNHANWLLLLLLSIPSCHMSSPESASVSASRLLHASQLTSVSHARFSSSCHSIVLFTSLNLPGFLGCIQQNALSRSSEMLLKGSSSRLQAATDKAITP